jgi:hypothetical protein
MCKLGIVTGSCSCSCVIQKLATKRFLLCQLRATVLLEALYNMLTDLQIFFIAYLKPFTIILPNIHEAGTASSC